MKIDLSMTPEQIKTIERRLAAKYRLAVIERIGALHRKYKRWEKEINELAALKKEAALWPAPEPGDQSILYKGRNWELEYSPRALVREITDMSGVMNALGQEEFLKRCTFALGILDLLVPSAADFGLLKEIPHAGTRRVEIRQRERRLKVAA